MTIHFNAKPRPAGGLPPRRRATLAVRRGEHGHLRRRGNPADRVSDLAPPHHVVVVANPGVLIGVEMSRIRGAADLLSGCPPVSPFFRSQGARSIPAGRRRVSTGACQRGRRRSRRLSCARTTRTGRGRSAAWLPESKPTGERRLARRRIHGTRRNSSVFDLGPHLAALIRGCEGRSPGLLVGVAFPCACPSMMPAVATSTCAVPAPRLGSRVCAAPSPSRRRSWGLTGEGGLHRQSPHSSASKIVITRRVFSASAGSKDRAPVLRSS